jgi:hypothetical protein
MPGVQRHRESTGRHYPVYRLWGKRMVTVQDAPWFIPQYPLIIAPQQPTFDPAPYKRLTVICSGDNSGVRYTFNTGQS